jgi:hypothetical protein
MSVFAGRSDIDGAGENQDPSLRFGMTGAYPSGRLR